MSLPSLINQYYVTLTVYRLSTVGNKTSYQSTGDVTGHIQPLDGAYAALYEGNLSKSFLLVVDNSIDIVVGDKVVISSGNYADTYFVKEVKNYSIGTLKHKEFIIEAKDV